ncbi:MAG TPA: GNAT family N-acetyltransferase [candidate division Zixibacteria bacterium]|nr:GNAT family N-acetyltransferase [candidate division Zixibacteria bacterium]
MTLDVRPFTGDPADFRRTVASAFGWPARHEDQELWERTFEADRAFGAYDGDALVGTAGTFSLSLTVPGGELSMCGVTMVGVLPTHRRRGALRRMMRLQLDQAHERGEPLAGLWASEGGIYGRFGFGVATFSASFQIERRRALFHEPPPREGRFRLLDEDEARRALPPIFEAVRLSRPGTFSRSEAWWAAEFFHDPPEHRDGGSPASYVLHETDGRPTGYARYRLYPGFDEGGPRTTLEVHEVMAVTPAAERELWGYLLDVDLVSTVRGRRLPPDHPLLHALADPRRLGWRLSDGLWLRVLDVPAALEGRGWAADGRLVLEVQDEFCAWNAGRWQLEVDGGRARVQRTRSAADLELSASELGSIYLGGVTVAALLRAGRVAEVGPGSASRADAMLRVDPEPWCPMIF